MSSPDRLQVATQRLRDAGYLDAALSNQTAQPKHVLSVTTEGMGCRLQVEWIVTQADPQSRIL
jgi:hypothetical protein